MREETRICKCVTPGRGYTLPTPSWLEPMAILPGRRLGPYEILSAIGAGGMGEVYKARDTRLDRIVAIKVLPTHLADRPELRGRFEREAKTIASLNHPHICTLYDTGHQDDIDFLVMEYIEGETLAQRLVKGALPIQQVLQYSIEISDALDKAHRKGVTHRDLKPGNIMLTKSGTKLLDFGLAKLKQEAAPVTPVSQLPTMQNAITSEGTILGTLQYMAPEQVEAKDVDARTDIFAFGTVVYEMATGRKAFEGKTSASVMAKILEVDPPSMASLQPMTPPALDRVVKKCLSKEPDDRWHAAKDLCDELKWIAEGSSQAGLPPAILDRRMSRELVAWSVLAAAIIAALALGAVHMLQTPKPGLPLQAVVPPPKDHNFYGSYFALSPDGRKIAFVASDILTGTRTLWARSLDSTTAQPLAGTEGALGLFWSPDSKFIGFIATTGQGRELKKIDAGGGPVITLAGDVGGAVRGTWGADGMIVLSRGAPEGLSQVSSNGGPVSLLTRLDTTHGEGQHRWVFFLPDGRHLLFEVDIADPAHGGMAYETRVLDLKTMKQSVLLRADSNAEYANGYLLYIQQANLVAQPFDVSSLTLSGDPVPVAQQVLVTSIAMGAFSASPSGLLAFEGGSGANSQLVWYTRDGKELGQVGSPGLYTMPSLSPDGTKATVSLAQGNKRDIWVFELARSIATRVTVDGMGGNYPVWSGDGTRVIYSGIERGAGIYSKPPSGLGSSELVEQVALGGPTSMGTRAVPNSISPDGKFLVYMNFVNGVSPRLWVHPFTPEKAGAKDYPMLGTNFAEAHAQFSPDGHWLAYMSIETGRQEIYVVPFPSLSSKLQISTTGGVQPRWRRDGKEIYYIAPDGKMMAVAVGVSGNSLKPDTPKTLFQTRIVTVVSGYHQYDVTTDGQKFLINSNVDRDPEPITLYANWTEGLKK